MRPAFDIKQAVVRFGPRLPTQGLTRHHKRTLQAIAACRTAALGGHIDACDECGHLRISYNSCRNRHCPTCQGLDKEMWAIQQEEQLLPVPYFHVVFTLPHELNGLCMHNPRFMYGLLLEAGWHTLDSFGSSPKWLGARTAATVVLHTWGQNLSLHPHIHCIVPSGGLCKDGKWQLPKRGNARFLYPVAAMKKVFRAFFMQRLRSALEQGLTALPAGFPYKRGPYYRWKEALYSKAWVAYTKKPFAGPQKVVQYLARYSHRIAITNHRILDIGQDTVRFAYKDYADGARKKEMALDGTEFLRRFCLHILPPHFRKMRHYGFLANACKNKVLAQALAALANKKLQLSSRSQRRALAKQRLFGKAADKCPCCHKGQMVTIETLEANKSPPAHLWPLFYN